VAAQGDNRDVRPVLLGLAAGLTAAAIVIAGWSAWQHLVHDRQELPPPPALSATALESLYAVALPDIDGQTQLLSQWRGNVLVVNYWATWCVPCREEMPIFSKLAASHAGRGVRFVGIAADDADKVREFVRHTAVSYPLLIGGEKAIDATRDFGNAPRAVPFTIVIDRAGHVRTAVLGRVEEDALARMLDGLTQAE